jgi:hypothetical protein
MATQNNLHIPDDLLAQARRRAESQGRTADDLATDALKRYLAHQMLSDLSQGSQERRRQHGLKTDEDVERYVDQVTHDYRNEQRSR